MVCRFGWTGLDWAGLLIFKYLRFGLVRNLVVLGWAGDLVCVQNCLGWIQDLVGLDIWFWAGIVRATNLVGLKILLSWARMSIWLSLDI